MKKKIGSSLIRILYWVVLLITLSALMLITFWAGRLVGALNPTRSFERPMCTAYETAVRESATGYVLSTVPAGSMVWFVKLDLPFALVAYYDGSAWIEGAVTANALVVCK